MRGDGGGGDVGCASMGFVAKLVVLNWWWGTAVFQSQVNIKKRYPEEPSLLSNPIHFSIRKYSKETKRHW